ncbi:MAG: HAD family hydrolase [Coleofasciculaceae cyanobacterium]
MSIKYDKLLVLDLDETLIYSTPRPLARNPDFWVLGYYVYKRPGVDEFLSACMSWFEIAVWTAASSSYAHQIVKNIFPDPTQLKFIFTGERCRLQLDRDSGVYQSIKSLKKIKIKGYSLKKVLAVDDKPESFSDNHGNGILVKGYNGEAEDRELILLLKYLKMIGQVKNVRKVKKKGWREKVK